MRTEKKRTTLGKKSSRQGRVQKRSLQKLKKHQGNKQQKLIGTGITKREMWSVGLGGRGKKKGNMGGGKGKRKEGENPKGRLKKSKVSLSDEREMGLYGGKEGHI